MSIKPIKTAKAKDATAFISVYTYIILYYAFCPAKKHAYINSILKYECLDEETVYFVPSTFLNILLAFWHLGILAFWHGRKIYELVCILPWLILL